MTRDELTALLGRVEQATGPDVSIDVAIGLLFHIAMLRDGRGFFAPSYTASLDAIVDLIERELPGCDYILEHINDGLTIRAQLGPEKKGAVAFGETDALALCAAFLRAKLAQVTE